MESCPCGSGKDYGSCCAPFLLNEAKPKTAEQLMRARYSAYAKNKVEFVGATHYASKGHDFDIKSAQEWANNSEWDHLEIVNVEAGQENDERGTVEFIAHYKINGQACAHHEYSEFRKDAGEWKYYDGKILSNASTIKREGPKLGRNDPCICGSGKKYKKCCLKN